MCRSDNNNTNQNPSTNSNMYPRTNYEMTEEDLQNLLSACKPVTAMLIGGYAPRSPQENANAAWAALGTKMGFDSTTVEPRQGMSTHHFSAVPSETCRQREDRLMREHEARYQKEVADARAMLSVAQERLENLLDHPAND